LEVVLVLVSLASVLLNIVSLPGNVVPMLVSLAYYLWGEEGTMPGPWLLAGVGIFLSGEIVEQLSSIFGAKVFGASRAGMLGAFLGGIVGAILGTALLPVVGTVLGVFAGCFVFAVLFELSFGGKGLLRSLASGMGSLLGKLFALAYKYAVGFALVAMLIVRFSQGAAS
jgi:hypothetical protein